MRSKMEKWLFQKMKYNRLNIVQQDLNNIYFNCFLRNAQGIYVGNQCFGFQFTVECDAPWGWEIARKFNFPNLNRNTEVTVKHYNSSDSNDYTYPYVEIQMGPVGGNFSIFNLSDNNRETKFTNLPPNSLIKMYNDYNIIEIDTLPYYSDRFNKKFFRLKSSSNTLRFFGDYTNIMIEYSAARKVGG